MTHGRKYLPELAGLKVLESFDAATGAYQLRPASRPPTVKHFLTHTSVGLAYPFTSAIYRDFKPHAGETYPGRRTAAVRSGRALALQHQH